MSQSFSSFEVYGFTIEVHAGGRRVWPPSFKRFVKNKLDRGELTVAEVVKSCNVSQSLIYKWRADVKASRKMDLSRFSAAPCARLGHFSFKSDGAFPAQC